MRGHGRQKGHKEFYRGQEYNLDLLPKVKYPQVECDIERAIRLVNQLCAVAAGGRQHDGGAQNDSFMAT